MRQMIAVGALALLAGCGGMPLLGGGPPLAALQSACGAPHDYGAEAPSVYPALADAWVARRRHGVSEAQYCAFANGLAERHAALVAQPDAAARERWTRELNQARADALSWRASVDPTLRGG